VKTIISPKVKIGAHIIETVFTKCPKDEDRDCWGTYEYKTSRIEIKSSLPNKKREETWIHEIAHAIGMDRGIGLTEKQVAMIAPAVYCFLVDNGYIKR
jgi:hypothetical protein